MARRWYMRAWPLAARCAAGVGLCLLGLTACSRSSTSEAWRDQTETVDAFKKDYIRRQVEAGISPEEAAKNCALELSILQTYQRQETVVEGSELQDAIRQ